MIHLSCIWSDEARVTQSLCSLTSLCSVLRNAERGWKNGCREMSLLSWQSTVRFNEPEVNDALWRKMTLQAVVMALKGIKVHVFYIARLSVLGCTYHGQRCSSTAAKEARTSLLNGITQVQAASMKRDKNRNSMLHLELLWFAVKESLRVCDHVCSGTFGWCNKGAGPEWNPHDTDTEWL